MRKLCLAALPAIMPSIVSAQALPVPGSIGSLLPHLEFENGSISTEASELFEGEYNSEWALGLEGGGKKSPPPFGLPWYLVRPEVDTDISHCRNLAPVRFSTAQCRRKLRLRPIPSLSSRWLVLPFLNRRPSLLSWAD
jgi:hypothetical protein